MRAGIIPCAGEGSRWGLFQKELLPIGDQIWLIDNTISAMIKGNVDTIYIVTSPNKIHIHANHFNKEKYKNLNLVYIIQKEKTDIWGAIKAALPSSIDADLVYFGMPDTIYPPDIFWRMDNFSMAFDIMFGVFNTTMPERFGVFKDGEIVNKVPDTGTFKAWGTFSFSKYVTQFWLRANKNGYTENLNYALNTFAYKLFDMDYYHDLAGWTDYQLWVSSTEHA